MMCSCISLSISVESDITCLQSIRLKRTDYEVQSNFVPASSPSDYWMTVQSWTNPLPNKSFTTTRRKQWTSPEARRLRKTMSPKWRSLIVFLHANIEKRVPVELYKWKHVCAWIVVASAAPSSTEFTEAGDAKHFTLCNSAKRKIIIFPSTKKQLKLHTLLVENLRRHLN